jgi:hypothetical protein
MTIIDTLRERATKAIDCAGPAISVQRYEEALDDFTAAASPATVLALLRCVEAAIVVNDSARHKPENYCEIPTAVVLELGDSLRSLAALEAVGGEKGEGP